MKSTEIEGSKSLATVSSEKAEQLMEVLANCQLPQVGKSAPLTRLRALTEKWWPDLWQWADETPEQGQKRAAEILRRVQWYLQEFWKSPDPHARDWYIHRLREYHHRHQIQPKTAELRQELASALTADEARAKASWLNVAIEDALNQPPVRTPFEESLFHLQRIAHKVRVCQNPDCKTGRTYFIAEANRTVYCCQDCSRPAKREAKLRWLHSPEGQAWREERKAKEKKR